MLKSEFENLAMRNNDKIGTLLYQSIEQFYMSTNQYHRLHGGIDETKQAFVKRVFGGKVNTPKTITTKLTNESIKENHWCLQSVDKTRHDEMDILLTEHYQALLKHGM